MSFRRRSAVAGLLGILALGLYLTGRIYSPSLVTYVVEESLIQKAPPGTDPNLIRRDLHALLDAIPDRDVRLSRVLAISQYVEKVQTLTPQELKRLLAVTRSS
ncbi:MAG TPA: hypothetical protein VE398_08220 [Acidobacteriota bacterium]|nr:hypothetical protein [Acidobacteriota bacterium]